MKARKPHIVRKNSSILLQAYERNTFGRKVSAHQHWKKQHFQRRCTFLKDKLTHTSVANWYLFFNATKSQQLHMLKSNTDHKLWFAKFHQEDQIRCFALIFFLLSVKWYYSFALLWPPVRRGVSFADRRDLVELTMKSTLCSEHQTTLAECIIWIQYKWNKYSSESININVSTFTQH